MSSLILWELQYLLSCFVMGIILILLYDMVRIVRIVLPHTVVLTGIEDLLYWLTVGAAVFLMLYRGNDGIIRWYAVAAEISGMILYNCSLSRLLVPILGRLLRLPIEFVEKVLKRIGKRVTINLKKIRKRWFHGRKKTEEKKKQ